ncbi:MAG: LysE family transporter [Rhodobacteraceae bacterium]|nr:LysE family transporter [Paracoccaceae bacterium]
MGTFLSPLIVHLLVVITPGPANILIMQRSASLGRVAGLFFAAGVITGAAMWAAIVFFAIIFGYAMSPWVAKLLGITGAAYLAHLGVKIVQGRNDEVSYGLNASQSRSNLMAYVQGLLLHATNPKAFFGWLAIVSVGRVDSAVGYELPIILMLCTIQASVVFSAYALLFSTDGIITLYRRHKGSIDMFSGCLLFVFAFVTLFHLGSAFLLRTP